MSHRATATSPLTRDDVTTLQARPESPAVSIYQPTHRVGREYREDRIRFKNLVEQASRRIETETEASEEILEPAYSLLDSPEFWQNQRDGLAVFAAPDFSSSYRLPLEFEERVRVGSRFHTKPLLPLLSGDGRYFLLALSLNRVRLFEGTRDGLRELDEDLPESLTDAMGYDHEQRSLQFHTGTGAVAGGKRSAIFHGQGTGKDDEQKEIEQFLRRLANALVDPLGHPTPPLVLAAAEPMLGEFRKVARYPRLVDEAVGGNHDTTSVERLHELSWPLVEPVFREEIRTSSRRLARLLGTDDACSGPREVSLAAHDGRVETLFVPTDREAWGHFDPTSREIALHQESQSGDQDLFDFAAAETLRHGGTVYALPAEDLPERAEGAAILRF